MKKQKTKNPLRRRLLRELKDDLGKYLVIFVLITATIGMVSGFLVADNSIYSAYEEAFDKYKIEDGHFRTAKALNKAQRKAVGELGISLYDNYYIEETVLEDRNLRIYADRTEVDLVCLMEGEMPQKTGEIAVDRMFADNNSLTVGSVIESENYSWTITGLIAMSDYNSLFEDNSDAMFDALTFGTAIVCKAEFAEYPSGQLYYNYAWFYEQEPADEAEEKALADDLLDELNQLVKLKDFTPAYQNQAITFTGEDMSSDKGMMIVLLYMIMAILAFVFAVTASNTIMKEANVIGTLRASGYTRGELVRHYMTLPVLVTIVASLLGNLLGYSCMKQLMIAAYYNSYSLPTYVTLWNADAFVNTTVVPFLLMIVINWAVLTWKLRLSPQQLLRREVTGRKNRRAFPLPGFLPFFSRFRTRVILQNVSNYVVLAAGILFANLLLLFGLGLPEILNTYQETVLTHMISNYQYMLEIPAAMTSGDTKLEELITSLQFFSGVETENEDAEKFMAYSLQACENDAYKEDEVTLYGIETDSRYVALDVSDDKVYLSSAYADKYGRKAGDTIVLKEKYEGTLYEFTIAGVYEYDGAVALFMSRDYLNRILDYDEEMFAGYFSNSEITDIEEEYLGTIIDADAMTKICRQLDKSMGSMMNYVVYFSILIFAILIYLLSKIIIEKNAQSISMAKILGYNSWEIMRLYILPTTVVVVLFLVVSLPLEKAAIVWVFRFMMLYEMTGWLPLVVRDQILVEMFVMGLAAYVVVAALELLKIRRVPMDMALKNVE